MCNITKLQVLWNLEKETSSPCGIEPGYFWFDIGGISVRNHSRMQLGDSNLLPENYLKSYMEDILKPVNLASN